MVLAEIANLAIKKKRLDRKEVGNDMTQYIIKTSKRYKKTDKSYVKNIRNATLKQTQHVQANSKKQASTTCKTNIAFFTVSKQTHTSSHDCRSTTTGLL